MGASSPLTGGARRPITTRRVWVSTFFVGALAVASVVALSYVVAAPRAGVKLSVSGMEKEAKLEHKLSEKVNLRQHTD